VHFEPFFEHLDFPLGNHAYQAEDKKEENDSKEDENDGDD
jgi:hypothetical protein